MPKISEFFGIAIYIYYREHMPPHFHAIYSGNEAQISIEGLNAIVGSLPSRVLGLVVEWASMHKQELLHVWNQAIAHEVLDKIEPLN